MVRNRYSLKALFSNTFIRNVSILASGAVIGQLVVVLLSPVLARLYTAENFGVLSVFTSVSTLLALFSTGRYELAIVLPESSQKALKLMKLIFYIAIIVSVSYFIVVFILKAILNINDPIKFLKYDSAYLMPVYVLLAAFLSALMYWNQRNRLYKRITVANSMSSIVNVLISIVLGFLLIENGMIWGLVVSAFVVVSFYFLKEMDLFRKIISQKKMGEVAKEYKEFPQYMTLSDLSLNANQQLTPILFSTFFNSSIVGHYALANKILRLPNIVITNSIANVFRNDAIDDLRINNTCRSLYKSTFKKLFLMSFPVYGLIFIISPWLFTFVFGSQWDIAGHFGQIISLFLFFEFIATPLNTLFYVRGKQKQLMFYQTINLIMSILMITIGALVFKDPTFSLIFFTINAVFFNLFYIYKSYLLSK